MLSHAPLTIKPVIDLARRTTDNQDMWWKLYYWINLVLMVIGLFALVEFIPLSPADFVSVILNIFVFLGIHSYVHKKKMFKAQYWKVIFWATVTLITLSILGNYLFPEDLLGNLLPFLQSNIPINEGAALFGIVAILPALYCLYKLSYKPFSK